MNLKIKNSTGMKGEYRVMVLDKEGNIKQDTDWFDNLLLDNFFTNLQAWAANKWVVSTTRTLRVGTGTTAPSAAQTALVAKTASTTTKTASVTNAQYTDGQGRLCQSMEETYSFTLGSIVATISEVGWFNGSDINGNTVHSRALITDTNGNPTSITLTNQDQLVIKYRITVVDIYKEGSGTITLNGQNYNWVSRRGVKQADSSNGWISTLLGDGTNNANATQMFTAYFGAVTFGAHGVSPSGGTNETLSAYPIVSAFGGEFKVNLNLSISQGNNASGIKVLAVRQTAPIYFASTKIEFTPAIPKTNQQILNLELQYIVTRA